MRGYLSSLNSTSSSAYKAEGGIKYFVSIPNVGLKWYDESFLSLSEESNVNNLRDAEDDHSYFYAATDDIRSSSQNRRCGWIYGGNILPVSVKPVEIEIDTDEYKQYFQSKRKTLRRSVSSDDHAYEKQQRLLWSDDLYPFIITISSFAESSPDVIYTVDVYLGATSELSRQQWVLHIHEHIIPLQRFLLFSRCNGYQNPSPDVFQCCRALCGTPMYVPESRTLNYSSEFSVKHKLLDSAAMNSIHQYFNWFYESTETFNASVGVDFVHLEVTLALEYTGLSDEGVPSLCALVRSILSRPTITSTTLPPSQHSLTLSVCLKGNALTGDGVLQVFSAIRSASAGYQGSIGIPCVDLSDNVHMSLSDTQAAAIAGILQSMGYHDLDESMAATKSMRFAQLQQLNLSGSPLLSAVALYHLMIPLTSHHSRLLAVDFSYSPQLGDAAATFAAMLMYNQPSFLRHCSLSHCRLTSAGIMELAQAMPMSAGSLRAMQICGYSPAVDCLLPLIEAINSCLSRSSGQVHVSIGGLIQELSTSPACRSLQKALPHLAESITMCGVSLRKRVAADKRRNEHRNGNECIVIQIQVLPVKSRASNGFVVAVFSPEELVGLLALHLHAAASQFVVLSVSGYSRDATGPYFMAIEVSCTTSTVDFELFQLHRHTCLAAQQHQYQQGGSCSNYYSAGGAAMAPTPTAQSIVDTLLYMAKTSHPMLNRLGLQYIRVAKSHDCANDFSGCRNSFQFVADECDATSDKYLKLGIHSALVLLTK